MIFNVFPHNGTMIRPRHRFFVKDKPLLYQMKVSGEKQMTINL